MAFQIWARQAGLYRKALKIAQKYNLPPEMVAAAEKKIS